MIESLRNSNTFGVFLAIKYFKKEKTMVLLK